MIQKLKKVLALDGNDQRVSKEEFMQRVQKKAYELYVKRGNRSGNDLEDWLKAERIVKDEIGVK
ncbi:MAG: DUF2934 domain-containing protein [Candidatus Omnitrophota bacterium]|nr:DUF2934 domain-containing protein [Candidatus Omnitrophota bacterium]